MAPFAGPSPEALIERLRQRNIEAELPLSMGGPGGPTAQFGIIDGEWCLYRMRVDEDAWMAFATERNDTDQPLYPEHRMQFLRPAKVLLRAPSRTALLDELAKVEVTLGSNYEVEVRPRKGLLGRLFGGGD